MEKGGFFYWFAKSEKKFLSRGQFGGKPHKNKNFPPTFKFFFGKVGENLEKKILKFLKEEILGNGFLLGRVGGK